MPLNIVRFSVLMIFGTLGHAGFNMAAPMTSVMAKCLNITNLLGIKKGKETLV